MLLQLINYCRIKLKKMHRLTAPFNRISRQAACRVFQYDQVCRLHVLTVLALFTLQTAIRIKQPRLPTQAISDYLYLVL